MKIQFNLPTNGYSAQITDAKESGRYDEWVREKFGSRITNLISDDYSFEVFGDHFVVDFTYEDDASAFLKTFGGRSIDE